MQFIYEILSFNRILTVSLLAWFVAQVLKTLINFILLGKFQLERMWGDGGMPSAHSATPAAAYTPWSTASSAVCTSTLLSAPTCFHNSFTCSLFPLSSARRTANSRSRFSKPFVVSSSRL